MEKNRYTKAATEATAHAGRPVQPADTNAANAADDNAIEQLPLSRINFKLMAASAVIIVVGFLLMLGPSAGTDEFNPDIYSVRRIVIAPTVTIIGFICMAFAIIYNGRGLKRKEGK